MTPGAGAVQCPHCGTMMDERARFCPGCGTPRTVLREQFERESAATGVPYEQLLERERAAEGVTPTTGTGWGAPGPIAQPPPKQRSRLWLILGIIGGVLLLLCVGCVIVAAVLFDRFNVDIGESPEGDAAREQLQLATAGRHEERWERLHPGQQEVVPLDLFATCARHENAGSVDIFGSVGSGDSFIPYVGNVDSRVVFYSLSDGGSNNANFVEMVFVDGEWRWTLTEEEIDAYESGRCP